MENYKLRAFKYIGLSKIYFVFAILFTLVPFMIIVYFIGRNITKFISSFIKSIFVGELGVNVSLRLSDFVVGKIYYLDILGHSPSLLLIILSIVVCLSCLMFLCFYSKKSHIQIYAFVFFIIQLISSFYFLLWGDYFPYSLTGYSSLYMSYQCLSWISIGVFISFIFSLFSRNLLFAVLMYWVSIVCIFVFGSIRYFVYLLFLHYASSLFMCVLFFIFGIFWDFIFVVLVFSIFTKILSDKYSEEYSLWKY